MSNQPNSLYQKSKANLVSLVKQIGQVGLGFLVMLLLTGGNPSGLFVGLTVCLGISFVVWSELKSKKGLELVEKHKTGNFIRTYKEKKRDHYSSSKRVFYNLAKKEGDKDCLWGGTHITIRGRDHFLVVGVSGSGKTLTLRLLMQSMLPKIQKGSNCRALIYDEKRDMLSTIVGINSSCPVWILNPFDERCVAWDMAKDITTYSQAEILADIFVSKGEKEDDFFGNVTKKCLKGVVEVFMENGSGQWELRDILVAMRSKKTLMTLLESSSDTQDCLEFFTYPATASSVMAAINTKMGIYRKIAALWHRAKTKISLAEWSESNGILVMGKDNEARDALEALNKLIFTRVAQILLNKPEVGQPQHFIILDELVSLGRLNQLEELVQQGCLNGVCVAASVLSIGQLENVYNKYNRKLADAIIGQFRHKAFLRIDDPATAEWASKLIRQTEIRRHTMSYIREEQYHTINAVKASEFSSIPPINKETNQGLTGYYLGRETIYKHTYTWDFLSQNLLPKSSEVKDFIPAPASYQKLQDWTDEDLHRLGIYEILNPEIDDVEFDLDEDEDL